MSLLARFSLANRGLIALMAVMITGFGLFAVPSLKQQLLPSMEIPAAFVMAAYPGAGPEIVEAQVTVPIEKAVQGVPGLESVTSTTREGLAFVQVGYEFGTDIDDAVNKMQTALNRISAQLPQGVEPTVLSGGTDDLPSLMLAASGGADATELAGRLRETVVPELSAIEGVRTVEVTGDSEQLVVITPDARKLAAARLPVTAIGTALKSNGMVVPAGAVADGDKNLVVQAGGRIATLDDLRGIYLTGPGARPVRLGDVAAVEQRVAPPTSISRTNGEQSLGISITATPDGNAVAISHAVQEVLADLEAATGAELTVVFDQAPFVEQSIETLTTEGLLGLIMAVLVILVFLLSIRSTIVTAVSIPLSVVAALLALWLADYSLNLLTLGALTIAVGRVVDDSIVVLENIKRHLGYGEAKRDAIMTGVREVAGAVTASTLTTVAVFAPIALVGGFVGQIFMPFAVTVTVALLASLLVSLTVIPVLSYWFLKPADGSADTTAIRKAAEERELRGWLQRAYLPVIRFATVRRWSTLAIGVLVLGLTVGLASRLETNLFDDAGQNTISVTQKMPAGTSLAATDAAARKAEAVLAGLDEVETYQVSIGGSGMAFIGGGGTDQASFSITLDPDADVAAVTETLRGEFDALGAGEFRFGADGGGFGSSELQVLVQAADDETLAAAAEEARAALADTPGLTDVSTSLAERVPRVEVTVKRAEAAARGLTDAAVGQLVAQAYQGTSLGQVAVGGVQQKVQLSTGAVPPMTVEQLRALPVPGGTLADVADITQVDGAIALTRIDGARTVTVSGTPNGSDLGAITAAVTERINALDVPGATFTVGGVSADQEEAFADLGLAVLAAIALVFLIMVVTFRSLIQPLILLVSVPFAFTGAIALLLITGKPLGVPALIGVLMLVGIVVTNAIVLLDLVNQYRAQGMSVSEAVVEGSRHRLRPILMTAIATIFALTPMAIGITGTGGFISQSLAIVVIGGLITSTLLTLVLVPTLYTLVEGARQRRRDRRGAARPVSPAPTGAAPAAPVEAARTETSAQEDAPEPARAAPSGALADGTDQFEVLRLPKSRQSPLPPQE
ncbi:efflux RND transporter permease subunit [Melissospora conviva]|uniref:efflux RND transporter permease subunit n=1 Tax=Melissospora conviva TaxID=3388432 RepID=UPI003B80EBEC